MFNVRFCRVVSLRWPMVAEAERAHRVGMAAVDASLSGSQELGLAAVAHLSRYRGTPREHTDSDLRVFLYWCQARSLRRWTHSDLEV